MAMLKLSLLLLVPKSVILYLICARASLKQPRAIVATHGMQNFHNCLRVFISSLSSGESRRAGMTVDLGHVPLGALAVESRIGSQLHNPAE
jgi:hypothetical protein